MKLVVATLLKFTVPGAGGLVLLTTVSIVPLLSTSRNRRKRMLTFSCEHRSVAVILSGAGPSHKSVVPCTGSVQ